MQDLRTISKEQLTVILSELSLPKFRANQILEWIKKGTETIEGFKNISNSDKKLLKQHFYISNAKIEQKLISKIDSTVKYLFSFEDGSCVESVVMDYHHGKTICLSTQVGCRMGCKFCATGQDGFIRNLTSGEIISQIYSASNDLNTRISNIVLMGMGEPFDNYENVVEFIDSVTCPEGLNIGSRHITLSTCGLTDKILPFFEKYNQVGLSISLHSAFNDKRSSIMPINKKFDISNIIQVSTQYNNTIGKRITFEYALIKGFNDSVNDADKLVELLKPLNCHVNLIPVNKTGDDKYIEPDTLNVNRFKDYLICRGINATIRRTLGADINASCGQLKRKRKTPNIEVCQQN